MIKLQNYTPEIYYKESRDFQFIGRLFDLVLNAIKTDTDLIYNIPLSTDSDEKLLELLALTLGFKPKKNYNSKQLRAICSVLPTILKHKGSIQALVLATNALLAAEGVRQPLDYTLLPNQGITLYVAQELGDLNLFTDLIDYLLPAGLSCNIIKESQVVNKIETKFGVEDRVAVDYEKENIVANLGNNSNLSLGNIGVNSGMLANVTLNRKLTADNIYSKEETKNEE
jgi:hypothetical protein